MPYKIRKVRNQDCYKVYKPTTKKVFAKCSTLKNAKSQVRLLSGLEYNAKFRKNFKKNYTRKSR
tara:strand:- start:1065 stop:1256 length:192 start_codon:yes stop_codon:yes gene_type:complete